MKRGTQVGICLMSVVAVLFMGITNSSARRAHITPEQKAQMKHIQTIYLHVIALTENGRVPADDLAATIQPRLEKLGYKVVLSRKAPHDVEFRVKCEERKKWAGTTRSGGDAELAYAPARLWKGPACLFSYRLQGQDLGWYIETRTDFEDAYAAAQNANVPDSGAYAMSQLRQKLQEFDFPVLIATEWGHTDRLTKLLSSPDTSKERKFRILSILSEVKAKEAFPYLLQMTNDPEYAERAIVALAGLGSQAIPVLTKLFKTSQDSSIQAAAAKSLGIIGAHTGDPTITPPLLEYLNHALEHMETSKDIDFPVLTEVVWSIAKLRNEKSLKPIEELNRKIWLIRDTSPEMQKLREAANVATKMIDLDYQIM
ncbi:MAG: HEAT repeat domain-containing protein [Nitrospirae bacterium]|nr:MAG: HEAT repeat domain-containing protein [Nitrospirota bacterium]